MLFIVAPVTVRTETRLIVRLTGITVPPERERKALEYLRHYVLGKQVILRYDRQQAGDIVSAYLYLTNRLFINRKMIEMGIADTDSTADHPLREKFLKAEARRVARREAKEWVLNIAL